MITYCLVLVCTVCLSLYLKMKTRALEIFTFSFLKPKSEKLPSADSKYSMLGAVTSTSRVVKFFKKKSSEEIVFFNSFFCFLGCHDPMVNELNCKFDPHWLLPKLSYDLCL